MAPEDLTKNPCTFKRCCNVCTKVALDSRPMLCEQMECPEFILCEKCHNNRKIEPGQRICNNCLNKSSATYVRKEFAERKETGQATVSSATEKAGGSSRKVTITMPGTPPTELNESEKEYYKARWVDYIGYYRNPAASYICSSMILEEININNLNKAIAAAHTSHKAGLMKTREAAIRILRDLKSQLPEKESEEVSDDEKCLNGIYEIYQRETKDSYAGGISRIFSPEAIALAPTLPFKHDLTKLLELCGHKTINIEEALKKITNHPGEKKTPEEILLFLGFKLNEKYALPYKIDENELTVDEQLEAEAFSKPFVDSSFSTDSTQE